MYDVSNFAAQKELTIGLAYANAGGVQFDYMKAVKEIIHPPPTNKFECGELKWIAFFAYMKVDGIIEMESRHGIKARSLYWNNTNQSIELAYFQD